MCSQVRMLKFLGPRGPLVLPLVDPRIRARAMKIWTPCIQAYMPHESSGDSSNQPDGHMGQFLQGGKNGRLMSFFF